MQKISFLTAHSASASALVRALASATGAAWRDRLGHTRALVRHNHVGLTGRTGTGHWRETDIAFPTGWGVYLIPRGM